MHERLSGAVGNPYAIWTGGDATIDRTAGINWRRKEFFQLQPVGLMKNFHQCQLRVYTIGEIELMTAAG